MKPVFQRLIFSLALCAATIPLAAQATRTWVSGVGDDANPGSRTAPCKTIAGAISKTAAGGEIDALDPGGFGAVTITKSLTLDGGGGQVASILVAGTNAIVVAAGPNDVVILRHFRFNGLGATPGAGLNGVRFLSGKALVIENCDFMGFSQSAVDVALTNPGTVSISNTAIVGVPGTLTSNGLAIESGSSAVKVSLDQVKIVNAGGAGILASSATADLQLDGVWLSGNATGLSATSGTLRLSGCTITQNGVGVRTTGASVGSFGNNKIGGNGSGNGPLSFGFGIPGSSGGNLALQ